MKRNLVGAIALVALLLAGCGGAGPSPTTPAPTNPVPTSATPSATAAPTTETTAPDDWTTTAQSPGFPSGGGDLLPQTVRTSGHDEFDRLVVDFAGDGAPEWRVAYVDVAIDDPRGQEVELRGEAVLELIVTGARYPEESEYDQVLAAGTRDVGLESVEQVHVSGIFEGQVQLLVGLREKAPFRVFTLTDPVRLVVDVQH